ncbi:uncharacterized protein LOC125076279 [Vanessa atalanta]|uniref:uncharacterized protein LOC125076279 n=1 Tax=Vanessa atalanta TaxID=42275 RepID=UPI001FCE25AF|nr:uncharacterized protein LOC125076279 [Vanessa atalanta]
MDKDLDEELFPEDDEPPQQDEINEGLSKLKKLFAAVDATVISIIASPAAGKATQDKLEQSPQTCKDSVTSKTPVPDHEDRQKNFKDADPKEPAGEDYLDEPN